MEIKDIKTELNILSVAAHYGCKPTRNNLIKCPFHEDDKPSLQLYPTTNTWHCFGCGKGTDAIDFIQLKENSTTHEAINKAKTMIAPLNLPQGETLHPSKPTSMKLTEQQRVETLTQAFTYFAKSTKAAAKQYLEKRALNPSGASVRLCPSWHPHYSASKKYFTTISIFT